MDSTTRRSPSRWGIAEPQTEPQAAIQGLHWQLIGGAFTNAGTATSGSNGTRVSDTAGVVFQDPASASAWLWSVQVSASKSYQRSMEVIIGGTQFIVQDVFPPLVTALTISAIRYFTGSTGRCIVVPQNLAKGPGDQEQSIYLQNLLATLRRGAIIQFSGGSEKCLVWRCTLGAAQTDASETFQQ